MIGFSRIVLRYNIPPKFFATPDCQSEPVGRRRHDFCHALHG